MNNSIDKKLRKLLFKIFLPMVVPHDKKDKTLGENMTLLLAHELGVDKDVDKAIDQIKALFEMAPKCSISLNLLVEKANRGNSLARLAVSVLHKMGKTGTDIDDERATFYLREAYPHFLSYKENKADLYLYWHSFLTKYELLMNE